MNVQELIDHLRTLDPTMPVAYRIFSEQCLLDVDDIQMEMLCEARPDGWVHSARPDKPAIPYLLFPGN